MGCLNCYLTDKRVKLVSRKNRGIELNEVVFSRFHFVVKISDSFLFSISVVLHDLALYRSSTFCFHCFITEFKGPFLCLHPRYSFEMSSRQSVYVVSSISVE